MDLKKFLEKQIELMFPGYENYIVNFEDNEIIWGNDWETGTVMDLYKFIDLLKKQ